MPGKRPSDFDDIETIFARRRHQPPPQPEEWQTPQPRGVSTYDLDNMQEIHDGAAYYGGAPAPAPRRRKKHRLLRFLVGLLIVALLAVLVGGIASVL
ncbi:MAG: hypothetical protein IIZ96_01490, partial [Oscillospiraceae bacterium]|nr:hypothetical protein [Oscillospiraceae bacterium]